MRFYKVYELVRDTVSHEATYVYRGVIGARNMDEAEFISRRLLGTTMPVRIDKTTPANADDVAKAKKNRNYVYRIGS